MTMEVLGTTQYRDAMDEFDVAAAQWHEDGEGHDVDIQVHDDGTAYVEVDLEPVSVDEAAAIINEVADLLPAEWVAAALELLADARDCEVNADAGTDDVDRGDGVATDGGQTTGSASAPLSREEVIELWVNAPNDYFAEELEQSYDRALQSLTDDEYELLEDSEGFSWSSLYLEPVDTTHETTIDIVTDIEYGHDEPPEHEVAWDLGARWRDEFVEEVQNSVAESRLSRRQFQAYVLSQRLDERSVAQLLGVGVGSVRRYKSDARDRFDEARQTLRWEV